MRTAHFDGPEGCRLMLAEWVDSSRHPDWRGISSASATQGCVRCVSVGWLVAECDVSITLASSASQHAPPQEEGICQEMEIPRVAIIRTRRLK